MLKVDGVEVPLVAGDMPIVDAWAFKTTVNGDLTTYRVYFPADGAGLLATPTPRESVLSYTVNGSATFELSVTGKIPATATSGQTFKGISCTSSMSNGPENLSTDTVFASVATVEPELEITKTSDPSTVAFPGSEVTYTITATAAERTLAGVPSSTAYNVVLVDNLPANLTVTDPGTGTLDAGTLTFVKDSLAPGESVSYTYKATVAESATGELTNQVKASMDALPDGAGKAYPDAGTASTTVNVGGMGPTVEKTADHDVALVGVPIKYTVKVTIPANTVVYNLYMTDVAPAGLEIDLDSVVGEFSSATPGSYTVDGYTMMAPTTADTGTTIGAYAHQITTGDEPVTYTLTYKATLSDTLKVGESITNIAKAGANSEDLLGEAVPSTSAAPKGFQLTAEDSATVTVGKVILSIDKSTEQTVIAQQRGQTIDYTIVVTNSGNLEAKKVEFNDYSWGRLYLSSVELIGDSATDPNVTFSEFGQGTIESLPANSSVTIHLRGTMTPEPSGSAFESSEFYVENNASITRYQVDGATYYTYAEDAARSTFLQGALAVEKTAPLAQLSNGELLVAGNQDIPYAIKVTNSGPIPLYDLNISDVIPSGWQLSTAPVTATDPHNSDAAITLPAPTTQSGSTVWKPTTEATGLWLEPGQSTTISLALAPTAATTPGTIVVNSATVTASDGLGYQAYPKAQISDTSEVSVKLIKTDLSIIKGPPETSPGGINQGGTSSYTVRITNNSPVAVPNVTLSDPLPANLSLDTAASPDNLPLIAAYSGSTTPTLSLESSTPATATTGQSLTWKISALDPGASLDLTIPVIHDGTVVTGAQQAVNTARITYGLQSKESTGYLNLIGQITPPSITKDADVDRAAPGQEVTYTSTITLNGTKNTVSQNSIAAIDQLPRGLDFLAYGDVTCVSGPCPAAVTNQAASLTMTPLVDDVQGKTTIGWNLGDWTPAGEDAVITVSYTARVQTNYGGTDPLLVPRPGTLVSSGELGGDPLTNQVRTYYTESAPLATVPTAVPERPQTIWPTSGRNALHSLEVLTPKLAVTKSADPIQASPGDNVTYTLVVENTGLATAYGVSLLDDLGAGATPLPKLEDVAISSVTSSDGDTTAGKASVEITADGLAISIPDADGGLPAETKLTITYTAKAPASENLVPYYTTKRASSSATINEVTWESYSTQPDGAGAVFPGNKASHELPIFTPVPDLTASCQRSIQNLNTPLPFTVTMVNKIATANSIGTPGGAPGPVLVPGVGAAYNTTIKVTLPAKLTYVPGSSTVGTSPITPTVTANPDGTTLLEYKVGTVEADKSVTVHYNVINTAKGDFGPTAVVTSEDASGATQRNSGAETYVYTDSAATCGVPVPSVDKTVSSNRTSEGETLTWNIVLMSPGSLKDPTWIDDLPLGVTYTPGTATFNNGFALKSKGGTIDELVISVPTPNGDRQRIVWTGWGTSVAGAPNQTATITTLTGADAELGANIVNTINVTSSSITSAGICSVANAVCDSASSTVVSKEQPTIEKFVDKKTAEPGDIFTYQIKLKVPAGVDLGGKTTLTDTIQTINNGMTGVSDTGAPAVVNWQFMAWSATSHSDNPNDALNWTLNTGASSAEPTVAVSTSGQKLIWEANGPVNAIATYDRFYTMTFQYLAPKGKPGPNTNGATDTYYRMIDTATLAKTMRGTTTLDPLFSIYSVPVQVDAGVANLRLTKVCDENQLGALIGNETNLHCTITVKNNSSVFTAYNPRVTDTPGGTKGVGKWTVTNVSPYAAINFGDPVTDPLTGVTAPSKVIEWNDPGQVIEPGGSAVYKVDFSVDPWVPDPSTYKAELQNQANVVDFSPKADLSIRATTRLLAQANVVANGAYITARKASAVVTTETWPGSGTSTLNTAYSEMSFTNAEPGKPNTWYIQVQGSQLVSLAALKIEDLLPYGFTYVPGSTRIEATEFQTGNRIQHKLPDPVIPAVDPNQPAPVCDPAAAHPGPYDTTNPANPGNTKLVWSFSPNYLRTDEYAKGYDILWNNDPLSPLGFGTMISFQTVPNQAAYDCAVLGSEQRLNSLPPQYLMEAELGPQDSIGTYTPFTNQVTITGDHPGAKPDVVSTSVATVRVMATLGVEKKPDGGVASKNSVQKFDVAVRWADLSQPTMTLTDTMNLPDGFTIGDLTATDAKGNPVELTSQSVVVENNQATINATWTQPSAEGIPACEVIDVEAMGTTVEACKAETSYGTMILGLVDSVVTVHIPVNIPIDAIDGTEVTNQASVTSSAVDGWGDWSLSGSNGELAGPVANGTSGYPVGLPVQVRTDTGDFIVHNPSPPPALDKTGPLTAAPGEEFTYDIAMTLDPNKVWTWLFVTDTLPAGLELVSVGTPMCDGTGCPTASAYEPVANADGTTSITWWFGRVTGSSDERVVHLPVTVRVPADMTGTFTNNVIADSKDSVEDEVRPDTPPTAWGDFTQTGDAAETTITEPEIVVSKSADKTIAAAGDEVHYTVTVANTGTGTAWDIPVKDTPSPYAINAKVTSVSPSGTSFIKGWTSTSPYMEWKITKLDAGESVTFEYTVTVKDGYQDAGVTSMPNTAQAGTYTSLNPKIGEGKVYPVAKATADVPLDSPFLTIEKYAGAACDSVTNAIPVGVVDQYCIVVRSTGTKTATNVVLTDILPASWEFEPGSFKSTGVVPAEGVPGEGGLLPQVSDFTVSADGSALVPITIGDMDPGTMYVLSYNAGPLRGSQDVTQNRASVVSDLANGSPSPLGAVGYRASAVTTTTLEPAALDIQKMPFSQVLPLLPEGGDVTWTIRVKNVGTGPQTNVEILDQVVSGVTPKSATTTQSTGTSAPEVTIDGQNAWVTIADSRAARGLT